MTGPKNLIRHPERGQLMADLISYAARFLAETPEGETHPEPTDETMAARFAGCVIPPPRDWYPAIRTLINIWGQHIPTVVYFGDRHSLPGEVCWGCSDPARGSWKPVTSCPQATATMNDPNSPEPSQVVWLDRNGENL